MRSLGKSGAPLEKAVACLSPCNLVGGQNLSSLGASFMIWSDQEVSSHSESLPSTAL